MNVPLLVVLLTLSVLAYLCLFDPVRVLRILMGWTERTYDFRTFPKEKQRMVRLLNSDPEEFVRSNAAQVRVVRVIGTVAVFMIVVGVLGLLAPPGARVVPR